MALIPAKVIARIDATSEGLEELSWEWVLRADGQVSYRLIAVDGHRERNPWKLAGKLPPGDMGPFLRSHTHAATLLASLARRQGHQVSRARGQLPTAPAERAPGPDAGRQGTGESRPGAHQPGREWRTHLRSSPDDAGGQAGNPAVPSSSIRPPHREILRADGWGRRKITGHTASSA